MEQDRTTADTNANAPAARPGPIPGIVVKGGKNPPVRLITVTSDENGEVQLNNLKVAVYQFQLSRSHAVGNGNNAAMARPGNPIPGIVVKGGKSPGGSFADLTVSRNGQIRFKVLTAGNYKLIITAANNHVKPGKEAKGSVSSGLKDLL